ncbi:hypothetical protein SDC9_25520 [bioreactor metagenome]|uniref:Uncharacterized protein n=1 Tax=bioreactor metagenome TaxID=1076179 RepID=A0A644UKR7_9ZZZZ
MPVQWSPAVIGNSFVIAAHDSAGLRRQQPLRCARRGRVALRCHAAIQDQLQHQCAYARAAGAERIDRNPRSKGEISGAHASEATALWLQTMAPLAQGDTVELQGTFRAADGYFAADHTSFWGCKVG